MGEAIRQILKANQPMALNEPLGLRLAIQCDTIVFIDRAWPLEVQRAYDNDLEEYLASVSEY